MPKISNTLSLVPNVSRHSLHAPGEKKRRTFYLIQIPIDFIVTVKKNIKSLELAQLRTFSTGFSSEHGEEENTYGDSD
jgi:hypothetical protein